MKRVAKTKKILSGLVFWGIIVFFASVILFILTFFYYSRYLPDPGAWQDRKVIESTKIYDRKGETLLYEIDGEEKRTVVQFDQIPQIVKDSTIVAEDADFYNHGGVNIRGILRAIVADIRGKKLLEGGSSITQQLIKNAYLTRERTFSRKFKELILAVTLERKYSKNEILNLAFCKSSF